MSWKLACADFTFPLLSHTASINLIGMMGFDGIDIGLFESRSHLWPSREFENVDRSAQTLKAKIDAAGLAVADVFLQCEADFVPFAINQPDAAARERARDWFTKSLEYAAVLDCRHLTSLPGVAFEDEEPFETSWQRMIDELNWRLEQAAKFDITFSVECHVGSIAPSPDKAIKLVNDVPGLTLTVDYTHFTRAGMPDSEVEPMLAHASHFHVRGSCKGRLQASFKDNVIDYKRVMDVLEQQDYDGYLGVEYVWIDWEHCNEVDNVSETILFRDFLRQNM